MKAQIGSLPPLAGIEAVGIGSRGEVEDTGDMYCMLLWDTALRLTRHLIPYRTATYMTGEAGGVITSPTPKRV